MICFYQFFQRQHSDLGFTAAEVSQIEGPTPKNTFGFKVTQNNIAGAKARHKVYLIKPRRKKNLECFNLSLIGRSIHKLYSAYNLSW